MKSIELFAGAGGLAIATANAGFQHEAVLEWNANACATIRRNKSAGLPHVCHWNVIEGDVATYNFKQHAGSVEFVSGGPPCQPFSIGGKHRGMDDTRNMFPHAVRAVREIRPKAFLFENVKGLTRKSFANYFAYIIHQLEYPEIVRRGDEEWTDHLSRLEKAVTSGQPKSALRYNVVSQLLNAADYGVPQRRERVLIVGIRADLGVHFAFPHATHEADALVFDQWVTGEYWERHRVSKKDRPQMPSRLRAKVEQLSTLWSSAMLLPWRTVRDAIADLPRIAPGQTCEKFPNHFLNPGARAYAGHNGSPMDEPAKTLKAGDHGVPGGENMVRLANGSVRYFSVRECARLQTFPDQWVLEGSWTESMRQLGNAVPVKMAESVAATLRKTIEVNSGVARVIQMRARTRASGCSRSKVHR
ncbi:MAG: DNA cytosine methyltransferase [Phycisphaeraceae bacterium]|nr:DNA cytosine methyltransferase [Phycisphaeraceae bacterium]MBX3365713.1 DNA cytosine methyltransferase [Phycisphaeraceae bacterium]QYK48209.1 MAG: DNA cytosine methyltransferase [Phycisphaeraceae bacterium]